VLRAKTWHGKLLLGAAQLLLTGIVTWVVLDRVGWQLEDLWALDARAWQPRWAILLLSCIVLLIGYVTSAAIWARVVADLGGARLGLATSSRIYFVSNLGRYLPGKFWQIAGLAVLAARQGVPPAFSTGAAVLGQAVALGGAALVGGPSFVAWAKTASGLGVAVLGVLASALLIALIPPLQAAAMKLWFRLARAQAPAARPGVGTTLRWLALYAINWLIYAVSFLLLVRGMGLVGDPLALASSFAAAYVLGYAAFFAPAGIGVRESFLVFFLSPHVGAAAAGAVSVVSRLWTTAVELVPAALLWMQVMRDGVSSPTSDVALPVKPPPPPGP
jgi:hypothetical protein